MTDKLVNNLHKGDLKALARCISIIENNLSGAEQLLTTLKFSHKTPIIGLTGSPGAGKSTLVNGLVELLVKKDKRIGIIAVDPSSPFNYGALLGDRIRMSSHYNNKNVFIRSIASRGSLGGLSKNILEVIDVMKAANFDYLFIETVGVGQSEVAIAAVADTTIVILVPEAGDHVQTMKAGLMEIADIFVVNKADRADAESCAKNLKTLVHSRASNDWQVPVLKTIATNNEGIAELIKAIEEHIRKIPNHKH